MPADRPRPTLADYVTIVISPALIMALIVSLVFFLLTILYRGEYAARLHYILFFFIFGMVLVARIAMEAGLEDRAPFYGAVLAFVVWLALGSFVDYPSELKASWLINAGLIALATWLAYQLTHSCTYIDEKAESTGTGVLQAAGLEAAPAADSTQPIESEGKRGKKRPGWRERYRRYREQRKKTQPPGVWVVYFGLAALPIFGLGQSLIDVAEVERRSYSFWLMTVYVASSLGLLVTTAFLGLRRYLRQRRLEMPKRVTAAWLTLGAGLLVALIGVGAALPRPHAEFSPLDLARAGSREVAASKHALTDGEAGIGKGKPGRSERDPDGAPQDGKSGKDKGGDGASKGAANKKAAAGEPDKKASASQNAKQDPAQDSKSPKPVEASQKPNSSDKRAPLEPPSWLTKAAEVLKWIVFGVVALVAAVFILGGGLRYLANFAEWARRLLDRLRELWQKLFGWRRPEGVAEDETGAIAQATQAPFKAFANPFRSGQAAGMTPVDLVRYSFAALEAWARERACGRQTQETPMEFTERLANEEPSLDDKVQPLGPLYARVLYARSSLAPDSRDVIEQFWDRLEATPRVSAHAPE